MRFVGYVVAVTASIASLAFFGASAYAALAENGSSDASVGMFLAGVVVSWLGFASATDLAGPKV